MLSYHSYFSQVQQRQTSLALIFAALLVALVLPALVHAQYSPGTCGCVNGGHCNSTAVSCNCEPMWTANNCGNLVCNNGYYYAPDNHCICSPGFEGLFCESCSSNVTCAQKFSHILERDNGTFICDKSLYMYNVLESKIYQCVVDEIPILATLGIKDIFTTIYCSGLNRTTTDYIPDALCNMQVWTNNGWPPQISPGYQSEIFYCVFSNCKQELKINDQGVEELRVTCHYTYCHETGTYPVDMLMINMFRSMVGQADLVCEVGAKRCVVKQAEMMFEFMQTCNASECIFVPENKTRPEPPQPIEPHEDNTTYIIVGSIIAVVISASVICLCAQFLYGLYQNHKIYKFWSNLKQEAGADFAFANINYYINSTGIYGSSSKQILTNVSGRVNKGKMLAIMGSSGAGKTTLLDILAGRNKSGSVQGEIYINNKTIDSTFQLMKGYVLQDPIIMDTMTVHEAVMFSAELRLPTQIPFSEKVAKVDQVLQELGISHIANTTIGSPFKRGVSGGELRRVAIACELVLSPNILFLDEPTSGLDSYNAHLVMETLSNLAQRGHTIIFSIHQPNSSIYSLFDDLLLLANGRVAYYGAATSAIPYFEKLGYRMPSHFNPADFIIDIVVKASTKARRTGTDKELHKILQAYVDQLLPQVEKTLTSSHVNSSSSSQHEKTTSVTSTAQPASFASVSYQQEQEQQQQQQQNSTDSINNTSSGNSSVSEHEQLRQLHNNDNDNNNGLEEISTSSSNKQYMKSQKHGEKQPLLASQQSSSPSVLLAVSNSNSALLAASAEPIFVTTFMYQFWVLAKRAFKNFLRNPLLFPLHVLACAVLGVAIGYIYWQQPLNFNGTQNRFGCFFFMCLLLAFGAMTSLELFHVERAIFLRERANCYYRPWAYYLSKVIFDVIPLRVIPPLFLAVSSYFMIGLRGGWYHFAFFLAFIVLFNVVAGALCLMVGVMMPTVALGNLTTLAINLYFILFGGIMVNFAENKDTKKVEVFGDDVLKSFSIWGYLRYTSPFQFVMEALLCNELNGQIIQFDPSGVPPPGVAVPGKNILKSFGFYMENIPVDFILLCSMGTTFLVAAGFILSCCVREKR